MTARRNLRLIYDRSVPGHRGYRLPACDVPGATDRATSCRPRRCARTPPVLPEVSEPEVVRHYIRLSTLNHHVDKAIYPLGQLHDEVQPEDQRGSRWIAGACGTAPDGARAISSRGCSASSTASRRELAEVVGMDAVSLHPAAGAQGELLGHPPDARSTTTTAGTQKKTIIIPDSAHGTNPATARMVGYEVVELKSRPDGKLDIDALRAEGRRRRRPAIMVTNPNTLGPLRERDRGGGADHPRGRRPPLHGRGEPERDARAHPPGRHGGRHRPHQPAQDLLHPARRGGPGAGPIAIKAKLAPFLPDPGRRGEGRNVLSSTRTCPHSVGRLHPYVGNVGIILRAFAYLRSIGGDGLARVSRGAIVNANYLMKKIESGLSGGLSGRLHARVRRLVLLDEEARGEEHRRGQADARLSASMLRR